MAGHRVLNVVSMAFLACAAVMRCECGYSQTNACGASSISFSQPPLELRSRPQPAKESTSAIPVPTIDLTPANPAAEHFNLVSWASDGEFHSHVLRSGEFYLTRPEPPSDSGVVRFVEGVFSPEVIHLGKKTISCSIITAVKRKNPLCLLNPIVFQFSW